MAGQLLVSLHREALPNGAGLWVVPMPGQPMVSARVLIAAGSQYETDGELGIAHFVEHMAFDLTRTEEMAAAFNALEDAGGEVAAVTGPEDVVFSAEAPADLLEAALGLFRDCIESASFEPDRVEAERRVILRELTDYVGEGPPGGRGASDLSRTTWERLLRWHPSTREPAGDRAILESVAAPRLEAFFRACYGTEGMTLILSGDLDVARAREVATRTVGALPRGARPAPVEPPPERKDALRFRDPEAREELLIGYRTEGVYSDDYFAHWYSRDFLTEALYDEVRRAHHVYYLSSELIARARVGMLYVIARAAEADHGAIAAEIDRAFEGLATAPLDEERFARLRARLVNRARRLEETSDEMAEHLLALATHYGVDDPVPDDLERLAAVTAGELHAAARRLVVPERRIEARSRRRPVAGRARLGLAALVALLAVLGLQARCHRQREDALRAELAACRLGHLSGRLEPPSPPCTPGPVQIVVDLPTGDGGRGGAATSPDPPGPADGSPRSRDPLAQ